MAERLSKTQEEADGMLMVMAQKAGGLQPLLSQFFGFLHRRTDFYAVIPDSTKEATMGFRPGVAERMVLQAFREFPFKPLGNEPAATSTAAQPRGAQKPSSTTKTPSPPPGESSKSRTSSAPAPGPSKAPSASATEEISALGTKLAVTEQGKQVPLPGNGGVTDRYFWQQSLQDLTVYVDVPGAASAKDIQCEIRTDALVVRAKGLDKPLLDGKYPSPEKVRTADSFWSFEKDTHTLVVSLEKTRETWWASVLEGEPAIDTTMVDSTRRVDEYDEVTQAHIRKVMFDQRQKAQGLPTSDELAQAEILERAKYLPGSPFLSGAVDENNLHFASSSSSTSSTGPASAM